MCVCVCVCARARIYPSIHLSIYVSIYASNPTCQVPAKFRSGREAEEAINYMHLYTFSLYVLRVCECLRVCVCARARREGETIEDEPE